MRYSSKTFMGFDHCRDVLSGVDSKYPWLVMGSTVQPLSLWAWWLERRKRYQIRFVKSCISCLPLTFRFDPDEIEVDVSSARSSVAADFSTLKLPGTVVLFTR
jgi:hypothetical protein